ncbi:MAG: polyprenyl synthetase family protein, partial [Chloroflexi bacterium]|nr:polyprenyl synthetase family protein [Chloroflexota bacterium]
PTERDAADTEATHLATLVERAGGREAAQRLAEEESAAALHALASVGLGTEAVALCRAFAEAVTGRES